MMFDQALQEAMAKRGPQIFQEPEILTAKCRFSAARAPAMYYCHQSTANTLHKILSLSHILNGHLASQSLFSAP